MGGWIQTRSGRWIDPLDPRPEDFDLSDVAHALAMICRFNGHCRRFYSVAEHSVHVSRLCPPEHALWGLLHDAAEAYLTDLPGPVKKRMPDYSAAERKLLAALCARFGLTAEMPEAVRQADRFMLANERDQLMPPSAEPWPGLLSRWPHVAIACDAPPEASLGFLKRYEELVRRSPMSLLLETPDRPTPAGNRTVPPLLGVDVGFSEKRQTTGIAWRSADGGVEAARAGSSWASRRGRMPAGFSAALVAIDGPLLPDGVPGDVVRGCESVFQLGAFQQRCKPGMSHFGTGFALRKAGAETMAQLAAVLVAAPEAFRGPSLSPGAAVIEAFPNAFLGVMLPHDLHERVGRVRRGRRFDQLYDAACAEGVLAEAASSSTLMPPGTGNRLAEERDHEKRAALLCLLTAAYAAEGTAVTIGNPSGGWFWLPPWRLWASWARDEVAMAIERVRAKGYGVELNLGA